MSGTRLSVDFYFKDMTPQQVNQQFPRLLPAIKAAKTKASKVNEGQPNEIMTVRAIYYICRCDENKPCDPEQEI